MAAIDDVRPLGSELERSYTVHVRGRLKFRVASDPHRFHLPSPADMRFSWVHATLPALEPIEARELVVDAWRMVVPQKLSRAYDLEHPHGPNDLGPE
jgi:hypothetical protein